MANGDIAAAAGLPVVPPTADIRLGYDEINKTRDQVASHMTTGTHTWEKVLGKPGAFVPVAHTHAQADVTGLDTALAGKANMPTTGALAVGSISGQQIGLRYEVNAVFKVDGAEFELASRNEVAAIEARLTAHGI